MYCLLFGIGFTVILVQHIRGGGPQPAQRRRIWFFLCLDIIAVILPVWIYAVFINPAGSFYTLRYFFVIMPHVFLITAYGLSATARALGRRFPPLETHRKYAYMAGILLLCGTGFQNYRKAYTTITAIYEPYREAAEYLAQDKQAYKPGSLIVSSGGITWVEYYFNKRGFAVPGQVGRYSEPRYKKTWTLDLVIDDSQYIQPVTLTEDKLLRYERIYLFEVHNVFLEDFISGVEQQYTLQEEIPGLRPPVPQDGVFKKAIKKILNRRPAERQRFGMRIYAKKH